MKRTRAALATACVVGALCLVVLVTAILVSAIKSTAIRDAQVTNTRLLENTDETLSLIQSCTTPGEPCYDDGQKRTAAAVGDINRVIVLAAACSVGLDRGMTVDERQIAIQECVIQRLAAEKAER